MPECKALATFNSRQYGFIRLGSRFSSDKSYADELLRNGLIEIIPDPLEPARTQSFPRAPSTSGNDQPEPPTDPNSEDPPDAGSVPPLSSSRAGLASRRKTSRSRGASANR